MVDCIASAASPAARSLARYFGTQDAVAAFFRKVQIEEVLACIDPRRGMSSAEYLDLVERRLANPAIQDATRRVAFDGSSGHAGFVLPVQRHALSAGRSVKGLALVETLWAAMCEGWVLGSG